MKFRNYLSTDFRSSIIVFLVALPLCMGIALASGAPLVSGLLAGVVGGVVAGSLSGSSLSVSGPAAGLTSIVAVAIIELGSYPAFLFCVALAGVIQIALGYAKAGSLGHFFPVSVIKGMLAGIGLILILKQIPHAVGYDVDFEGDDNFLQADEQNTFSEILNAWNALTPGAVVIATVSISILLVWNLKKLQRLSFFRIVPAALVVVVVGTLLNVFFRYFITDLSVSEKHLVSLPDSASLSSFFTFPDFSVWLNPKIYTTAFTIAIVASIETLLNIEACDKLDPHRRTTPLNRELKAQGTANLISGLIGGLPVTSVIVRSSTNVNNGAMTKASAISHGVILLLMVVLFPTLLQMIPLSSLAAILIVVGFKLTSPDQYKSMYKKGMSQFLPFVATVVAVTFTNLLSGVLIGIVVAIFFILRTNFYDAMLLVNNGNDFLLKTTKDVSFLNKASLRNKLQGIPPNSTITIDGSRSNFIDADIKETIGDFIWEARSKNIKVELKRISI
ncbi:MAG: SulP family inorganic anion transporter [Bacteroidetes bacterium]|nr:SulP family inorganic anion transporter [Bacteroidota bacterium]